MYASTSLLQVSGGGWAALPCGAVGLSAVCDCGISLSYSLTIFNRGVNPAISFPGVLHSNYRNGVLKG